MGSFFSTLHQLSPLKLGRISMPRIIFLVIIIPQLSSQSPSIIPPHNVQLCCPSGSAFTSTEEYADHGALSGDKRRCSCVRMGGHWYLLRYCMAHRIFTTYQRREHCLYIKTVIATVTTVWCSLTSLTIMITRRRR